MSTIGELGTFLDRELAASTTHTPAVTETETSSPVVSHITAPVANGAPSPADTTSAP
jgi:hypothetical protein